MEVNKTKCCPDQLRTSSPKYKVQVTETNNKGIKMMH